MENARQMVMLGMSSWEEHVGSAKLAFPRGLLCCSELRLTCGWECVFYVQGGTIWRWGWPKSQTHGLECEPVINNVEEETVTRLAAGWSKMAVIMKESYCRADYSCPTEKVNLQTTEDVCYQVLTIHDLHAAAHSYTVHRFHFPTLPRQISCGDRHLVIIDDSGRALVLDENDTRCNSSEISSVTERRKWQSVQKESVRCGCHQSEASGAGDRGKIVSQLESCDSQCAPCPFHLQAIFCPMVLVDVSCGKDHVLLLDELGRVLSFGLGSRGQLGHGDVASVSATDARVVDALDGVRCVSVAAGGWHSLALLASGDVYAWGWNESGQLGISPPCAGASPDEFNASASVSEAPLVSAVPLLVSLQPEDCESDWVVVRIGCGSRHSAALTSLGKLFTWGWGKYGQLGHSDNENRLQPTLVSHVDNVDDVVCGDWHTLIVFKCLDNELYSGK